MIGTMKKHEGVISYLVDVKGYSREEAEELYTENGGTLEEMFSSDEIEELREYSQTGMLVLPDLG